MLGETLKIYLLGVGAAQVANRKCVKWTVAHKEFHTNKQVLGAYDNAHVCSCVCACACKWAAACGAQNQRGSVIN